MTKKKKGSTLAVESKDATKMEKKAYDQFFLKEVPKMEKEFRMSGKIGFTVLIGMPDRDKAIKFVPFPAYIFANDPRGKDILAQVIQGLVSTYEAICVCMMTEAWKVAGDPNKSIEENMEQLGQPSDHPDKEEICMFTFESENIRGVKFDKVHRDNKEVNLELGMVEDGGSLGGRFSGFLNDKENKDDK